MAKTIEVLQGDSTHKVFKYVCLIEGIGTVLSDAGTAACQAALAGTDWESSDRVECFVELNNESKLSLWQPFTTGGRCRIRVHDQTDSFATMVHRRLYGAETVLTDKVDRDAPSIPVATTLNFTGSGEAHCGTECFSYSSTTGTSFNVIYRGLYSPFGTESGGSGGDHFGNHHRVMVDATHAQLNPLVTQLPRTWMGRRCGIWLHTIDSDGALNSKADAQLVFAGRITSIADDPESFHTIIDLEHLANTDIKDATIGDDLFSATIPEGMYLVTGRRFSFRDSKDGTEKTASDLEVVSGTPANAYEIQTGYYTCTELCEKLNDWLGAALTAGDIYGHYNWQSPVSSNDGLRTKCYWKVEDGGYKSARWTMSLPAETAALLGLTDAEPDLSGYQRINFTRAGYTNKQFLVQGIACPFASVIFKPLGPGRIAQEFGEAVNYELVAGTGAFIDQYSLLPYAVKPSCDSTKQWGIFLLDEKIWMVGSYDDSTPTAPTLNNCWIAPFTVAEGAGDTSALPYIGRRLDEPERGPVTVRQVLVLESTFANLMLTLAYSTGTAGYNHATYDSLGYGLGWNMPGSLLGPEFERSITNLPGAQDPLVVVVDEPTKYCDLFTDDLIIRWAFIRWRDQGFEFGEWKTPVRSMAAKSYAGTTLALTEANKADAAPNANHRIASIETNEFVRPIVKFDYCRDFGSERNTKYLKSVKITDQRAVDDAGGGVKPLTLKLRHSFAVLSATGAAVEKLIKAFIERINLASKAGHTIVRTIDSRYYEGYGVGDIALVTDSYARDPLNGTRAIASRPMKITRLSYSLGGPTQSGGKPRDTYGEVELMALDVQRGTDYAPAARIDDTAANAGYDNATKTLTCYEHAYSHDITGLGLRRGGTTSDTEDTDAAWFPAGSEIHIIEMDPPDPANPDKWERTVASQSGNEIVMTNTLSAPAWDATKKYRIVPQRYSQVVTAQQDAAYQADDADQMVEDETPPWHYSVGGKGISFVYIDGTEQAELIPDVAFGDGRPYDPGFDHAIAFSLNGFHDYKSAHQSPFLMSDEATSQTAGPYSNAYRVLYVIPYFLGTEALTSTITRTLTVAPLWRDNAGGQDPLLRVSIARTMPTGDSDYVNVVYAGESAQTATWTTSSTTWTHDSEQTLEINCKDIFFGYVFLLVEGTRSASTRGLYKLIEGPRTLPS